MFDLTNRESFLQITNLINEVKENASNSCVIILCGNKSDCTLSKTVGLSTIEENDEESKYAGQSENGDDISVNTSAMMQEST